MAFTFIKARLAPALSVFLFIVVSVERLSFAHSFLVKNPSFSTIHRSNPSNPSVIGSNNDACQFHHYYEARCPRTGTAPFYARKDWEEELSKAAQPKESDKFRAGETVAGAVLGGLLLGPFGAFFGASVGSSIGRNNVMDQARQKEMDRLGLSKGMLESAREIGIALERNMEGLKAVQESLDTQKRLARRFDADAEALYTKATEALTKTGDEEAARIFLLERESAQEKLKTTLQACVTAKQQVETMEANTAVLEQRAMEFDALLRRRVGAKAVQDSGDLGMSLSTNDPLLDKFRDLGIN